MKNKEITLSKNLIKIQRLPMFEIQLIFGIAKHSKHLRTIVSFYRGIESLQMVLDERF